MAAPLVLQHGGSPATAPSPEIGICATTRGHFEAVELYGGPGRKLMRVPNTRPVTDDRDGILRLRFLRRDKRRQDPKVRGIGVATTVRAPCCLPGVPGFPGCQGYARWC